MSVTSCSICHKPVMDDNGPIGDIVDMFKYDFDGSLDYIMLLHRKCALAKGYKIKNDRVVTGHWAEAVTPHPKLHFWLVSAVTEYDRRQEGKPGFNRYALPQYLKAIDDIEQEIREGASIRFAVEGAFIGRLQTFVLKWLEKQGARLDESQQVGTYPQVNEALPEPGETVEKEEVRRVAGRFQVVNRKGKPVGSSHPSYSAAQKADQAAQKKHYQESADAAVAISKNECSSVTRQFGSVKLEVAPPGKESWVKANKSRFKKKYGDKKGTEVLYATAWKNKGK